jgi:tetratricopeptide (TPR) repeat protein
MKSLRFAVPSFILLSCFPLSSPADEPHQHGGPPPERLGKVDFPISCSDAARQRFVRGVALLHSFWYDEAQKAFTDVTTTDPGCAMGYWGIAMSTFHPIWAAGNPGAEPTPAELERGREAVRKAKSIGAKTERERDYVAAVEAFYDRSSELDHKTRARAFESAMEQTYRRNPQDREAAIFYALAILGTVSPADKSLATQKKAAEILNPILLELPEHPGVAHYLIHSLDYPPLAQQGLPAARSYARVAPDSPHALHMPSHIFTRLGLWEDSIQSNLASSAAAQSHVARTNPSVTSFDDLHAQDYLEYAYLQTGQDGKAKRVAEEVSRVRALDVPNFAAAYALAAVPARYAIERRRWEEAASLSPHPQDFPWAKFQNAQAITHFARALGAARNKTIPAAREDLDRIESIGKALRQKGDEYWAGQVEIARREAAAWIARAEGKDEEAVRLARSAVELEDATDKHPVTPGAIVPAHELLGDLLLEIGQPAAALKEYEASLALTPDRFNGLSGAGRAANLSGDPTKARAYFGKLIAIAEKADGRKQELAEARGLLAASK